MPTHKDQKVRDSNNSRTSNFLTKKRHILKAYDATLKISPPRDPKNNKAYKTKTSGTITMRISCNYLTTTHETTIIVAPIGTRRKKPKVA